MREPSTEKPVGAGLPPMLRERLAAGRWLRTAHGGAPYAALSNTAGAIEAAAALGVDVIEVDVRATADGRLVLWHDEDVVVGERHLPIAATPLDTLRALDLGDGVRVLELREVAGLVGDRATLMLDLKEDGLEHGIVEALRDNSFEPVVVCGHYWHSMREIKRQVPETAVSLTLDRSWQDRYGPALIERLDTAAVTVDWRVLDPALAGRCHARGLAVLAWTVDEPELMRRVLALGADGLTSNRPDLFAAVDPEQAE